MPISADAHVELTDLATPLLRRSRGRLASDEAVAVGRIAEHLDQTRRERAPIGELIRECGLTSQVIATLIRSGALIVLARSADAGGCEKCGAPSATALCADCRRYLSGSQATMAPPAAEPRRPAAPAQSQPAARRGMLSSRRGR